MKKLAFFSAIAVSAALFAGTPKQLLSVRVASLNDLSAAANEIAKMIEQPALGAMAAGQLQSTAQQAIPELRADAPGMLVVYASEPEFSKAVAEMDLDGEKPPKGKDFEKLLSIAAALPCEKMPALLEKDETVATELVEFPSAGRYVLIAKSMADGQDKAILDLAKKNRGIAKSLAAKRPGELASFRFARPACKAFAGIMAKAVDKAVEGLSKDMSKGCPPDFKPHVQKMLDVYAGMARCYVDRVAETDSFSISLKLAPGDKGGLALAFDTRYVKGTKSFALTTAAYPDARELAARLPGKAQLFVADTMSCNPKVLGAYGVNVNAFATAFADMCKAALETEDLKKEIGNEELRAELLNLVSITHSVAGIVEATGEFAIAAGVKPSKRIWFKSVCGVFDPSAVAALCGPVNKSLAKIANIVAERPVAAEETLPDGATALKIDFDAIIAAVKEQCPEFKDADTVREVLDMLFGKGATVVSGVEGNFGTTVVSGSGEKLPAPAGKRYGAIAPRSAKGVVTVGRLSAAEIALPFVKKYCGKDFAANPVADGILKKIPASTGGITLWRTVEPGAEHVEIKASASEIKAIANFVYAFQALDAGAAAAADDEEDDDDGDDDND